MMARMNSLQSNKQLATVAFRGRLFVAVASFLLYLLQLFLRMAVPVFLVNLLNLTGYTMLGLAAFGFLIMWLNRGGFLDFFAAGFTGAAALFGLLTSLSDDVYIFFYAGNGFLQIATLLLSSLYFLPLAARAGRGRPLLRLAMLGAFLWSLIGSVLFLRVIANSMGQAGVVNIAVLLISAIDVVIALCSYLVVKGERLN